VTVPNASLPGYHTFLGRSMLGYLQLSCNGSLREDACRLPGSLQVGDRWWVGGCAAEMCSRVGVSQKFRHHT